MYKHHYLFMRWLMLLIGICLVTTFLVSFPVNAQ
jgi:hypothetical protein